MREPAGIGSPSVVARHSSLSTRTMPLPLTGSISSRTMPRASSHRLAPTRGWMSESWRSMNRRR